MKSDIYRHTLEELEAMTTLSVGQAEDLKIEEYPFRVWLSRCNVADGEPYPNRVTITKHIKGEWVTVDVYQAL